MIKRICKTAAIVAALVVPASAQTGRNIATAPIGFYVDNNGNDANDGLTPATAKQHYCTTLRSIYNDWDFRGYQPFMFVRSGQFFNEMCNTSGALVGVDAIIIAPFDPANLPVPGLAIPTAPDFIRTCSPPGCGSATYARQWCDAFGDLAIQIYYNATWADCNHWNAPGGAAIVVHNVGTLDIFGPRSTFSGRGDQDSAIFFDGTATFTVQNAPLIEGQFAYPITCMRGCIGTISGPFDLYYANVKGYYSLGSGSHLELGVPNYTATSSVYGPSVISGYSTINLNGIPILGGYTNPYGGLVVNARI